jgi:hypothetical protein
MKISSQTTIQQVFNQFAEQFSHLRLEFYQTAHGNEEGSRQEDQISHATSLGTINPHLEEQVFQVDGNMTVSEFENMMRDKYKLNVQVFRKSADVWLQTTATDHWSLDKQNSKGQVADETDNIEPIDITDFDVE